MKTATTNEKLMHSSEANLIALMRAVMLGSEPAFIELYRGTYLGVYHKVLRILRNRVDAEDVVQDVYVKVWLRSQQFKPCKGGVKGWINAIARNLTLDLLRIRKRTPETIIEQPFDDDYSNDRHEIICSAKQPLESAICLERQTAVRNSLQKLSVGQRDCLKLASYEDLSQSQIAVHLGIPLGTVKTWVSRSYISLRPILKEYR
jgi:RNA polymerase sigma-70 factor, ECF subfamily